MPSDLPELDTIAIRSAALFYWRKSVLCLRSLTFWKAPQMVKTARAMITRTKRFSIDNIKPPYLITVIGVSNTCRIIEELDYAKEPSLWRPSQIGKCISENHIPQYEGYLPKQD
jgi:hypothetical protein